jgi:hypothetical protein
LKKFTKILKTKKYYKGFDMKQIVFIASVLLFFVATNFAQSPGVPPPPGEWGRMGGKIEQLE